MTKFKRPSDNREARIHRSTMSSDGGNHSSGRVGVYKVCIANLNGGMLPYCTVSTLAEAKLELTKKGWEI